MLIIESVNPTGMFSFGACQDIDLINKGLVNLVGVNDDMHGDSNGAGKSSMFNGICEVCYQENPTKVSGDAVINTVWNQGFSGRVVFTSWEDIKYRVTYCRKQKTPVYEADNDNRVEYNGTALFFDKFIGDSWVDCRGEGMESTKKLVRAALGLTYDQFVAVAYMTPRQGNVLLRGVNKARMDVLSGLVGLDAWDKLLETIKREKTQRVRSQNDLEMEATHIDGQISQLTTQIQGRSLASTQTELKDAQTQLKCTQDLSATDTQDVAELEIQLTALKASQDIAWLNLGLDKHTGYMADIQSSISGLKVERANCRTSINPELAAEYDDVGTVLNVARGALAAVKGDNALVDTENCPTCGVRITKTARAKMAKSIKAAEKAVAEGDARVHAVREAVEKDRRDQEVGIAQRQRDIDAQITTLEVQSAQATDAHNASLVEYNAFKTKVTEMQASVARVQAHLAECRSAEAGWQARIDALNATVTETKALGDLLVTKQAEYDAKKKECEAGVHDLAHYTWFVTNIPYIKLHKLSVALGDLSDLANGYLQAMGDTARISISSFKAKKKATSELTLDQLKGEVSVTITDGQKNIDPRLYSDGETARFSAALARAIHDLAVKHGCGCNLVLLDEIFSFVGVHNRQTLANSFTGGLHTGLSYLVTDNSGVAADLMDFDSVWTVTKENGLSQLAQE